MIYLAYHKFVSLTPDDNTITYVIVTDYAFPLKHI